MASVNPLKVRESRSRRAAERQGLVLLKSRRRDPLALDFGTYWLANAKTRASVFPLGPTEDVGASLDEIERFLRRH